MKTRLTKRGKLAGGLGLLLALALVVTLSLPAFAAGPPQRPHTFWGSASVCSTPAVGAVFSAEIDSTVVATTTVDLDGHYGHETEFKFPGENGDLIQFYIDGKLAEFFDGEWRDTFVFQSGGTTELDLVVPEGELTVTANPPAGGVVTGGGTFACGIDTPITATAEAGWEFDDWTGTGITDSEAEVTTVLIDGNKTVTANFSIIPDGDTYELTVLADPDDCGIVTGTGPHPADTWVAITADPDVCCDFVNWTGCEGIADPNAESTTVLLDADKTVTANFNRLRYTLTVIDDPPEGGDVTGGDEYDCCTDASIMAVAATGWYFNNWTGDDIDDSGSPATTVHIDGDKTVTAHFAEEGEVNLTVNSTEGGSVTDPGEDTFPYTTGDVVDLVAERECGFVFLNWSGDIGTVADVNDPSTTITMNGNYEVTANFASGLLMGIDLDAGWNTFSTPIALDSCIATWEDFVDYCGLDWEIGYYYNVSTKYWGLITGDRTVTPLEGYYVSLGTAGTALIVPNPEPTPPPYKELAAGLNLIGLASLTDKDVVSTLTDVYEVTGGLRGYSRVMNPPINGTGDWPVDNNFDRDDAYVPTMEVGYSYWVIMINPGGLYGFTETPLLP